MNSKGLFSDSLPVNQPDETYPYGKNGLLDITRGSVENEPGFTRMAASVPYRCIGVIETDKYPVLFSTDNINSAIGYFNVDTDEYIPIINDSALPFKLGFKTSHYIRGEAQRNYKNQIVVAFTDKLNPPRYLNCDEPDVSALQDLNLFPFASPPTLVTEVVNNGTITPGAYIIAARYLKFDGTESGFVVFSDIIIVPGNADEIVDKAINIQLSNCDPSYDQVEIAVIQKVRGVMRAFTIDPVGLNSSAVYNGSNLTTDITLEEILIPAPVYTKVQAIGQLNDSIYITGLETEPEIKMQKWASLVKLKWTSELINAIPYNEQETRRGFMHQEAYMFAIRYKLAGGRYTKAFIIPGPDLTIDDLAASTEAATGGYSSPPPKYQMEDTIPTFSFQEKSGEFGKWKNSIETYPDTEDFDATSIGGRNLRGQPVLHHRFPSIAWTKSNLYPFEAEYGKTKLDILGVKVENVLIPASLSSQIIGWELLYARRTVDNSTVLGQSLLLHGGRKGDRNTDTINSPDTDWLSTGGNWNARVSWGNARSDNPIIIDPRIIRLHPFDILFNKPALTASYIAPQLKHKKTNIRNDGYLEDGAVPPGSRNGPLVYLMDYALKGITPVVAPAGLRVRKIVDDTGTLIPNNIANFGKWKNRENESAYGAQLEVPMPSDFSYSYLRAGKYSLFGGFSEYTPKEYAADFETTYLTNLMAVRDEIYAPYTGQTLIRAGTDQSGDVIFGGDTFVCDYTFHTNGSHSSDNDDWTDGVAAAGIGGIRGIRRFVCEAVSNINARFEVPGNIYTRFYPKSPLTLQNPDNYIIAFNRKEEFNQFGYNKDLNTLNDILNIQVFDVEKEDIYQFPFRIHRGGKIGRQNKRRSWRTFLPLDYYEMQKDKGLPINLEGMDDQLLIHTEYALFGTQDKARLEQDILSVTLGTGDIFQFEPQEVLSSKRGYGGTQHDLACVRTPIGYLFVDSDMGQVFMFKKNLQLINNGLQNFFDKYLRIKEKNVFIENGYTIGYDQKHRRFLLTAKNRKRTNIRTDFAETPEFFASLSPGDIVYKDGRYQEFLGENTTAYDCDPDPDPFTAGDEEITIPETTASGTVLLTLNSNYEYYLLTSGVPFTLSTNGVLKALGPFNFDANPLYTLDVKVTNSLGQTDTFTITVNITDILEPPVTGNYAITIPENTPVSEVVLQINAVSPAPLNFAIVSGNDEGHFGIDPLTGELSVAGALEFDDFPVYLLTVAVSDGTNVVNIEVRVDITHVESGPIVNTVEVTIYDTTPDGTVVAAVDASDDDFFNLTYSILEENVSGVFSVNTETGAISLNSNTALNPLVTPQYILTVRATDSDNMHADGQVIINVTFDPATIEFSPQGGFCSEGCPPGWTLTPDGLTCEKITEIPATPPSGSPVTVDQAQNIAYNNFGAIVYKTGYLPNGVGEMESHLTTTGVWANDLDNTVDGALNRCGVWGVGIPDDEYIGFSVPVTLTTAKTYYIGVSGDNACRIKINGVTIVDQDPNAIIANMQTLLPSYGEQTGAPFKWWHIYPVELGAGTHYITVEGVNYGAAAGFGAEIYDNTPAELAAAALEAAYTADPGTFPLGSNHYSNLNLEFSTRSQFTAEFDTGTTIGYSCPPGYALDGTVGPPVCKLVERTPADIRTFTTINVHSSRLGADVQVLNNIAGQTYMGIPVPYYPPVAGHVACGGTVQPYYNVPVTGSATKNNCATDQIGTLVPYSVPGGLYVSLISQADADAQAVADISANVQANANTKGGCL